MKKILLLTALCSSIAFYPFQAFPQEAAADSGFRDHFLAQQQAFPQEKIYLHNDKPFYIAGEDIWFRVYLLDYASHLPDSASRYVYVELVNPADSILRRVKVRQDDGIYKGYIPLPEDVAEGDYQLRCYTRFMEGLGEDYFFRRKITVGGALSSHYRILPSFVNREGGMVQAGLTFLSAADGEAVTPTQVRIRGEKGKIQAYKPEEDGTVRFILTPERETVNRTLRVEYDIENKTHEQFIPIPANQKEYDVSFFAEGGNFPAGRRVRIAFKALGGDGLGLRVSGEVFSKSDPSEPVTSFRSNPLGMGSFYLEAEEGKAYYAVCRSEARDERRFDLPETDSKAVSLQCTRIRDGLNMAVICSPGKRLPSGMRLITHCRGSLLYDEPWDTTREYIRFGEGLFPSGVIHFLLTDEEDNPVSERLVFNLDETDLAKVSFDSGKPSYKYRDLLESGCARQ